MFSRAMLCFAILVSAALAVARPDVAVPRQQLIYESLGDLENGMRVGIFVPAVPVALGLRSVSGPHVMIMGELLNCRPFEVDTQLLQKTTNGGLEELNGHEERLNCGPMALGGEDRILEVIGIQWRGR